MGFLVVLLGGRIIIIPVNLFQTSGGGTCLSDWMYYLGFCGFALPERGGGGGGIVLLSLAYSLRKSKSLNYQSSMDERAVTTQRL